MLGQATATVTVTAGWKPMSPTHNLATHHNHYHLSIHLHPSDIFWNVFAVLLTVRLMSSCIINKDYTSITTGQLATGQPNMQMQTSSVSCQRTLGTCWELVADTDVGEGMASTACWNHWHTHQCQVLITQQIPLLVLGHLERLWSCCWCCCCWFSWFSYWRGIGGISIIIMLVKHNPKFSVPKKSRCKHPANWYLCRVLQKIAYSGKSPLHFRYASVLIQPDFLRSSNGATEQIANNELHANALHLHGSKKEIVQLLMVCQWWTKDPILQMWRAPGKQSMKGVDGGKHNFLHRFVRSSSTTSWGPCINRRNQCNSKRNWQKN